MVDFPETLEELIPEEVLERWMIDTRTPIDRVGKRSLFEIETGIAESNTIVIRYSEAVGRESRKDARIREFMRLNGLVSVKGHAKHSTDENMRLLREWAVARGKKISFEIEDD